MIKAAGSGPGTRMPPRKGRHPRDGPGAAR
jgi:hypothetical protein